MREIDLDAVFKDKNPKLYKLLPKFVMQYLKRIVHQKEINDFLKEHGELMGNEYTKQVLKTLEIEYTVEFTKPITKDKKYILASNHPLGGADGIILLDYFSRYFDKVKFPVNDLLLHMHNVKEFFVPINKHGKQSKQVAQLMNEAFESDAQILLFPAGLVSRRKKRIIRDPQWRNNFIFKARKYKRDIVPIHISGSNSNFFYNLANIRTFLGVKTNIEMLYLSDELFKHKGQKIKITVGKPIKHETFDKTKTADEWSEYVKNEVYDLVKKNDDF